MLLGMSEVQLVQTGISWVALKSGLWVEFSLLHVSQFLTRVKEKQLLGASFSWQSEGNPNRLTETSRDSSSLSSEMAWCLFCPHSIGERRSTCCNQSMKEDVYSANSKRLYRVTWKGQLMYSSSTIGGKELQKITQPTKIN